MPTIKITPYTLMTIVAKKNAAIFQTIRKQIEPVLISHNIPYFFSETKLTKQKLEDVLRFPTSVDVVILCVNEKEEVAEIMEVAKIHNYNTLIISVENQISKRNFKETIELNLTEQNFIIFEQNLSVRKTIEDVKLCVVGDIHGSYEAFLQMLLDDKGLSINKKTNKLIITNKSKYVKHVLIGDYIDKGSYKGIKKTIELIENNLEHFEIIVGNHEHWVAEYLRGHMKPSPANTKIIGTWFQSVVLLLQDEKLKEKFFHIYNNSFHSIETPLAIITHAPCSNIYLYKEDEFSMRRMRNLRIPKPDDYKDWNEFVEARDSFFQFLKDDASQMNKYHIFGHTMIPDIFQYKNKICIDTGCVVGGKLSVALFDEEGGLSFKQYENPNPEKLEILVPYFKN